MALLVARYPSPLRYPGGKQRLSPFLREILRANGLEGREYAEPFAGGAGVAIDLLLGGDASRVHLNDSSFPIYAFWHSVLLHSDEFCNRIRAASLTVQEWQKQRDILRHPGAHCPVDVGFSAFYLNRCNRSGVLSGGLIGGLKQTGAWRMDARFPRNELIRRVELIAQEAHRISITNLDAEEFLSTSSRRFPADTLIYCDPPYYDKSNRLYLDRYARGDHARLACFITELPNNWVVSYDAAPAILDLYAGNDLFTYSLQYNASTVRKGTEVFVFSRSLVLPSSSSLEFIDLPLRKLLAATSSSTSSNKEDSVRVGACWP